MGRGLKHNLLHNMEKENSHIATDKNLLTLSARLRTWRMSVNMSIEEIAAELNIRPQFISALEHADYSVFPARVYAAGYLKSLTGHFHIPESHLLIGMLKEEWDSAYGKANDSIRMLPGSRRDMWYITPRRLFMFGGSAIFLFFIWFLVTQVIGFTGAPALRIDEPYDAQIAAAPLVRIKGLTEKESQLTVNGREITMNGKGAFDETIELPAGVNTLHFLVRNRFGKQSAVTRYVVVQ